jgi:DNA-directed RNA polymerase III subunit RPC8
MFVIVEIKDSVRLMPNRLGSEVEAISQALNQKFVNKVIKGVGLVVTIYEILATGEQFISIGDAVCHASIRFSVVAFRPSVGEVLTGKILSSNALGVSVSLGFFDSIFIPPDMMPANFTFQGKGGRSPTQNGVWVWTYRASETSEPVPFELDPAREIRFRVVAVTFPDQPQRKPPLPVPVAKPAAAGAPAAAPAPAADPAPTFSALTLLGSLAEPGLGSCHWWS